MTSPPHCAPAPCVAKKNRINKHLRQKNSLLKHFLSRNRRREHFSPIRATERGESSQELPLTSNKRLNRLGRHSTEQKTAAEPKELCH